MDYYYKMVKYTKGVYTYAYSRKGMELDGRMSYDRESGTARTEKLCGADRDIPGAGERAEEVFYTLVSAGFPTEMKVEK